MTRNKRIILYTILYVTVLAFIFYNYSSLQYTHYLDTYKHKFEDTLTLIDQKIEVAKGKQEILNPVFSMVQDQETLDTITNDPYISFFEYTFDDIKSPYFTANFSSDKQVWINQMYNTDSQLVVLNVAENLETITIGSRYGKFNSMYSGVLGLIVDLQALVEGIKDQSSEGIVILSDANGNILYHEDYVNATKPNIAELYPSGNPISSVNDPYTIMKVVTQGTSYIVFQSSLTENNINVSYVIPWLDVFYQWQVNTIALGIMLLLLGRVIYKYVKNTFINYELKKMLGVKSKYIDESMIQALSKNVSFKDELATYFEIELIPLIIILQVLSKREDDLSIQRRTFILGYLNQKLDVITAHTRGEIDYDKAQLKKFQVDDILELTSDVIKALSEFRHKTVVLDLSQVTSQDIYSYPNAIWIIALSIYEELTHNHDTIAIEVLMRGTLNFRYKVDYILSVDESKINRMADLIKLKYHANLIMTDDEIIFEWPIIKQNHLSVDEMNPNNHLKLAYYKLSYGTEKILKILSDQLEVQLDAYEANQKVDLVFVEATSVDKFSEESNSILRNSGNIVLLYEPDHRDYMASANLVNAKGLIQLPLDLDKIKKVLSAFEKERKVGL